MRRALRLLAVSVCLAMALPVSSAIAADCPGSELTPAADNIAQVAQATLCLLNAQRASAGLAALSEQGQLTQASAAFSQLMVDQHFFAHVSPSGSQLTERLTAAGYLGKPGSWLVGENIAWGEAYLATPANIVKAWMNSPPHRANILNGDFEEIGFGIVAATPLTTNAGATYTTDFGRRRLDSGTEAQSGLDVAGPSTTPAPPTPRSGTKSKLAAQRKAAQRRAAQRRRACRKMRRSRGAHRAAIRVAPRKSCAAARKVRSRRA